MEALILGAIAVYIAYKTGYNVGEERMREACRKEMAKK